MAKFGIGQSVRRLEDPRLLTGGGRYTDDTRLSQPAARLYVLRSPHAHADIRKIDTAAARKAPGVLAVFTGAEVEKEGFGDVPCLVPLDNRDGAPLVHDHIKNNIVFDWAMGDQAATDAAFKTAARTVSLRIVNQRLVVNSM